MTDTNDTQALSGLQDTQRAVIALVKAARRSIMLYTPYIDPSLYNDTEVVDAMRSRAVANPRMHWSLLLPPADIWRHACPRLIQLTEHLTSGFELRVLPDDLPRDRREYKQGFLIADETALLHQTDPRRLIGTYTAEGSGKTRELFHFFTEIWQRSEPDPELRQLGL